jgi:phosphoribosylaminoimidazole-succinocarboxamide synthase
MKELLKLLVVVGAGVVIGSMAGKYLKAERRFMGRSQKGIVEENNLASNPAMKEKEEELESYFI